MDSLSPEQIADLWFFKKSYTVTQAATLWVDECPTENVALALNSQRSKKHFNKLEPFHLRLDQILDAIGNGVDGELEVEDFAPSLIYNQSGVFIGENWDRANPDLTSVCRNDLIKWALKVTTELPVFLKIRNENSLHHTDALLDVLLDESHPYHIRDLAIAIRAWVHFYVNDNLVSGKDHAKQVRAWIERNYRFADSENPDYLLEILPKDTVKHIGSIANKAPGKQRAPKKVKKEDVEYKYYEDDG